MNRLLRPQIWPSFLASSGVGTCDVPFRYASDQSRGTAGRLPSGTSILFALAPLRSVPQAGSQLRGLATAIHEISGLDSYQVVASYHPTLGKLTPITVKLDSVSSCRVQI
jgi:hypothetical protein